MQQLNLTNISSPFIPEHIHPYLAGWYDAFTHFSPSIGSIQDYAKQRTFSHEHRKILSDVMKLQYTSIHWSQDAVLKNIEALEQDDAFTLTTGQQIHVLWWPIFFVTKILDVLELSKHMNEKNDGNRYIPVFWMASEDHDLEEINYVDVYGEKFTWNTQDTGWPVGRYSTQWLMELVLQVRERLDESPENDRYLKLWEYAYAEFATLAQATHRVLDHLFGEEGLIVLDADNVALKSIFVASMKKECVEQVSYNALVKQTSLLEEAWLDGQAIPKDINLFYMTDTSRTRIVPAEVTSLLQDIESHPERFSPNVFLRTIYQESILPNLVYIAWPGEIKYWLQMKEMFEAYDLKMPVLLPRQLTQYLSEKYRWTITESDIDVPQWFVSYEDFLSLVKEESDVERTTLYALVEDWKKNVSRLETSVWWKQTKDKNVLKSVKNIRSELETLERRLVQADEAGIEASKVYGKLLKIHKRYFDVDHRFEREQFVVGNVELYMSMKKDWTFEDGVKVVIR